jgi:glycerol-3-phosphate acyltransferase PlsX
LSVTIAVDAMGGDHGPPVVVPASLDVLEQRADLRLTLVGDQEALRLEIDRRAPAGRLTDRLSVRHASQRVEMDEPPGLALRNKKDSSMRVAVDLVKDGAAAACVSAGNTGALMATARFVLKTLPGIDRPAIITALPTTRGHTHVLDLGANVDATPEQLYQFAVMGSVLVSAVDSLPSPTVGLLNIGEEPIKGSDRVKETARLLTESDLNYIGFVEGDDIYRGGADVVVCDGFVGNVALKSSEGVAHMISQFLREEFKRSVLTRLAGLVARPVLQRLRKRIDPRRYNGASFLGLRGIVVKSHGGADRVAFAHALLEALKEVDKDVPRRISEHLGAHLADGRRAS